MTFDQGLPMTAAVLLDGKFASMRFQAPFDMASYQAFLAFKRLPEHRIEYDSEHDLYTATTPARYAHLLTENAISVPRPAWSLEPSLFDYQAWITDLALDAERFACWLDKTRCFLEFGHQVSSSGRVLIVSPGMIIAQTIGEARLVYGDDFADRLEVLETREALASWCAAPHERWDGRRIAFVNPEKFIAGVLPELRLLAGLVVDESSFLKSGGGVIKWNLIKSARGIPFKLSCTATPAPNDRMEYASQASFLEKLRDGDDSLWTYFKKDNDGNWEVRPHARQAFYRYMSGWSAYMRDPAHYGFADILKDLPAPEVIDHTIALTPQQTEHMIAMQVHGGHGMLNDHMSAVQRSKFSQLAKGFLYNSGPGKLREVAHVPSLKPKAVADIVCSDVRDGRQVIVWTVFDEESAIIEALLAGQPFKTTTLHGTTADKDREARISAFKSGSADVLITKATMAGYGLNFQNCRSQVWSGFTDSFELFYQGVRRSVRFGQTETVRVHRPVIPELEGLMFENIMAKQARFDLDTSQCERFYAQALGVVS